MAVSAAVEAVAGALARGGGDGGDRAQVRPRGFGAQPLRVVPGGDQEQCGGVRADTMQGQQSGCPGGHERDDELTQALRLIIEELGAPPQFPQRDPGGVANDIAGAGPQRRQAGDQVSGRIPGEAGPQVIGPQSGPGHGPG